MGVNQPGGRCTPFLWLFVVPSSLMGIWMSPLVLGGLCSLSPHSKRVEGLAAAFPEGVLGGGEGPILLSGVGGEDDAWCPPGRTSVPRRAWSSLSSM